jgi:AcrR family transcriptional regulator
MTVLDAEGLDAVTMRRIATDLGTGPASLYAHVADKDELVAALLDRVISEVPLPERIEPERWQDQLRQLIIDGRAAFGRHRDIARASMGFIPTGQHALVASNMMLGIMLEGGVEPRVAAYAIDILALYMTAYAYEDSLENAPSKTHTEDFHEQLQAFFTALPADRLPYLVAMAEPLTGGDGNERFEFGLDLLIRGIASTVK